MADKLQTRLISMSVIKAYLGFAQVSISNAMYITQPEHLSQKNVAK